MQPTQTKVMTMQSAGMAALMLTMAACLPGAMPTRAEAAPAVDLSMVPQLKETPEQREARMKWFHDAKFGMFLHLSLIHI